MTPLLTIQEAAARLHVSDGTIKNEIRRGRLGYVRVPGHRLIEEAEIAAYIERNRRSARQPKPTKLRKVS